MSNVVSQYVLDLAERAVKTAAQAAAAAITVDNLGHVQAFSIDWPVVASFALGGAFYSVLTSLASQPIGDPFSASILPIRGNTPAH